MNGGQLRGEREERKGTSQPGPADKWRGKFQRRRRMRDPMLVFNMSMFNFGDGWNHIFNRLKVHENGT
jgi:hypothetical protein